MSEYIEIRGARVHNLRSIDVRIPRNRLTVITGVSGSGKSSLAFDTLYEEGKRRYMMFSGTQFAVDSVPSFDRIDGLSPTVAVEQRIIRQSNPRSTVGTRTKITNMLAILFATGGTRDPQFDDGIPLAMEMFLKNSPKGMCVKCLGLGTVRQADEALLFADRSQRIADVCLGIGRRGTTRRMLDSFCAVHGVTMDTRLGDMTEWQRACLLLGDGGQSAFPGFIPWIRRCTAHSAGNAGVLARRLTEAGMMKRDACPRCGGTGLNEYAAHTRICDKSIQEMEGMYVQELFGFLDRLPATARTPLLSEILLKLQCLTDVGLGHLALSRPVPTLSGGEIQRLFLASYIIAGMDGLLFVFDEPTIGLHEVEKNRLIATLLGLVRRGNTVVAVEHDENFIRNADWIIDLGPDAGRLGGDKVFEGTYPDYLLCDRSRTAPYLRETRHPRAPGACRPVDRTRVLTIENATIHNLRHVTADIPLGRMVGVTGVSGSGKSSLIADTLVPCLRAKIRTRPTVGATLRGVEQIRRCHVIDQRPIGRSRTSCPATYTGLFDRIRALFADTDTARAGGLTPGHFTANHSGGCRICRGDGVIRFHVGFGDFVETVCEDCGGTGFIEAVRNVVLDGKSIREVLDMTVDEAVVFFGDRDSTIRKILLTLQRVGMGYITLGQKIPTISGGESQRIKLATELSKTAGTRGGRNTLYLLDEPTTGLSPHDSRKLMGLLQELVDSGSTVVVVEHDPYVLSQCDHILEMGPGGGREGGGIIAAGTPAELRVNPDSTIGRFL